MKRKCFDKFDRDVFQCVPRTWRDLSIEEDHWKMAWQWAQQGCDVQSGAQLILLQVMAEARQQKCSSYIIVISLLYQSLYPLAIQCHTLDGVTPQLVLWRGVRVGACRCQETFVALATGAGNSVLERNELNDLSISINIY